MRSEYFHTFQCTKRVKIKILKLYCDEILPEPEGNPEDGGWRKSLLKINFRNSLYLIYVLSGSFWAVFVDLNHFSNFDQ